MNAEMEGRASMAKLRFPRRTESKKSESESSVKEPINGVYLCRKIRKRGQKGRKRGEGKRT